MHWGFELVRLFILLSLVLATAGAVLWWAKRRPFWHRSQTGRLHLIERLPLDQRRYLALVRIDGNCLLVAVGDSGPPRLLKEVAEMPPAAPSDVST